MFLRMRFCIFVEGLRFCLSCSSSDAWPLPLTSAVHLKSSKLMEFDEDFAVHQQ